TRSSGEQVSYDENGNNASPNMDVLNWVWLPDGGLKVQKVGVFKTSTSGGEELILDEDRIFWSFESTKVISAF
ncbi:hypothetical protein, partial [Nocardioides malaquae]|uniref:hypothetical protein n=1 Tax=Nocardioides malaquae TaxID=2773426 RepID=UPI001D0D0532